MVKQIKRYKKDVHGMLVSVLSRHVMSCRNQLNFEIDFNQKQLLRWYLMLKSVHEKFYSSRTPKPRGGG